MRPAVVSLTCDVVGVVEAVAVEFAGLGFCGGGALFAISRLAEGIRAPLTSAVAVTGLRRKSSVLTYSSSVHNISSANNLGGLFFYLIWCSGG